MKKIAILEPGAWGTVLGILLSKNNDVGFWYGNSKLALKLSQLRKNERLPGVKIPKKILISSNLKKVIKNADLIIIASPSFYFRKTIEKLKEIKKLPSLLGLAKGIEKETCFLPSQIVKNVLGKKALYSHLSGPGFAREVIRGKKAKEVIASKSSNLLRNLKKIFDIRNLEISTTRDLIGLQLAGAFKNVISIGIGLVEAKNPIPVPQKIKKTLIHLGLKEMIRLGKKFGAKEKTFKGPAGLGDLILTASPLSRNWQFGRQIFKNASGIGKVVKEKRITVEGFDSAFATLKLTKKYKIKLPIISEICNAIFGKVSPEKAVENLINLAKRG